MDVIRGQPKQTGYSPNKIPAAGNSIKNKIKIFFFRRKDGLAVANIPGQMVLKFHENFIRVPIQFL